MALGPLHNSGQKGRPGAGRPGAGGGDLGSNKKVGKKGGGGWGLMQPSRNQCINGT